MKKTKNLIFYFPTYLVGLAVLLFSCNFSNVNQKEEQELQLVSPSSVLLEKANLKIDSNKLDQAIHILDSSLSLRITDARTKAEHYAALGFCQTRKEKYHDAVESYLLSEQLYRETKDSVRIAQMQYNSANIFKIIGLYDRAAKSSISAKGFFIRDSLYKRELAIVYNLLGNIHKEIESYELAIRYHLKSLEIRNNTNGLSSTTSYNNIGNVFVRTGKYDSALLYYNIYKTSVEGRGGRRLGKAYYNIARTYLKKDDLKNASMYIDSAFNYYTISNHNLGLLSINLLRSKYYFKNNIVRSEQEARSALKLSQDMKLPTEELDALKQLSKIYSKKGDLKNALIFSESYNILKDKVDIESKSNKIYSYEMLSQLDIKNAEIERIEEQKIESQRESESRALQRNFFIVFCLFSLGFLYMLYKRYIEKKRFVDEYFASETGVILKSGRKLSFKEIKRVETYRNDLILFTDDGKITEKGTTLKSFVPSLPKLNFGRAQRGIVVNFANVQKVLKTKIEFEGEVINLSANFKDEFLEQWDLYLKSKKA